MHKNIFRNLRAIYGKVIIESLLLKYYNAAHVENLYSDADVTLLFEVYCPDTKLHLTPYTLDNEDLLSFLNWIEYNDRTGRIEPLRVSWIQRLLKNRKRSHYPFSVPIIHTSYTHHFKRYWKHPHTRAINRLCHYVSYIIKNREKLFFKFTDIETYRPYFHSVQSYCPTMIPLLLI